MRTHVFNNALQLCGAPPSRWLGRDRLAPVSVGLVFAGTYSVLTTEGAGVLSWIVTEASVLLLLLTRVHPLLPLAGGALIFLGKLLLSP
jgi:hypothetical protein